MIEQVTTLFPFVLGLQDSHIVLHYPNLSFIEAYSIPFIYTLKYISIFSALLLALGILSRISALLFALSFGYLFLIDMSWYNNHYYLWCLMAFMFAIVDTNHSISIIDVIKGDSEMEISDTAIQSFKWLISIVYLYAALVKINPDWLQGYPATIWFENRNYARPNLFGLIISYTGLFYDLLMPIMLWYFARKWWIIIPYFLFHFINSFMFNIGMFPFIMMVAWLLFSVKNLKPFSKFKFESAKQIFAYKYINSILFVFFVFHVVFPLRYWMYDGRTSWHRQGYYFSWRMMLDNYHLHDFRFKVVLPSMKNEYAIDFDRIMTYRQFENIYNDSYALWYVAQVLAKDAKQKYKEQNPQVYCTSIISLNQHLPKALLDSTKNLEKYNYYIFKNNKFINL